MQAWGCCSSGWAMWRGQANAAILAFCYSWCSQSWWTGNRVQSLPLQTPPSAGLPDGWTQPFWKPELVFKLLIGHHWPPVFLKILQNIFGFAVVLVKQNQHTKLLLWVITSVWPLWQLSGRTRTSYALKYSYAPFCADQRGSAQALLLLFHHTARFQTKGWSRASAHAVEKDCSKSR